MTDRPCPDGTDRCPTGPEDLPAVAERPTLSFELYPPRTPQAEPRLWETVRALEAVRPDFVSVTYGASGSTRATTRALVRRLLRETSLTAIVHLTCVGTSREEVAAVVREFLDEGVRAFLALRGDPPADDAAWTPHPEGVETAAELVALLRRIEADRVAASPAQAVRATVRPLSLAVAAFPRGNHATGGTRAQDVRSLLEKQAAGADFAITQVVHSADDYAGLVAEARAAGVRIPVIPGVLPATDPARLRRLEGLTGVPTPTDLLARLDAAPDARARYAVGVDATAALLRGLLDAGAPGLHLYTFNQHRAPLDALARAGLAGHHHEADAGPDAGPGVVVGTGVGTVVGAPADRPAGADRAPAALVAG
ncbi:methylenetetrahydrofolate reductase [Cellulomonas endophytica]|uniref:methylenetetrahydrofolate reductase n=1 Tax=Cellulomonas endophytica TaxID=2494735 RepID=UPI001012C280|nr:methylenetetrahydrofolate reductase [Cellulomonas endophytica]